MQTYKELTVWKQSVVLVKEVYVLASALSKDEKYGLVSQMRRAAVSIPANIAEGYARKHRLEYVQFLRISFGSGAELETYLTIIKEIGIMDKGRIATAERVLDGVMRMLNKLIASLDPKP